MLIDMKKWAAQRADLQLDIQRVENMVTRGQPRPKDDLHKYLINNPYVDLKSKKGF